MHEHALVKNIVESLLATATKKAVPAGAVKEVVMKVGMLEFHSEEAFRQTFEVLLRGTPLEGAKLNLTVIPAAIKCPACGHEGLCGEGEADPHSPIPAAECPKCGVVVPVTGGRGVEGLELVLK